MIKSLVEMLRCPVTRSRLSLIVLNEKQKKLDGVDTLVVNTGILLAEEDFFYPVINGIPRLIPDAVLYYDAFFNIHLPDFEHKKNKLFEKFGELIRIVNKKNKRTLLSFSKQWSFFNYDQDKTWNADKPEMLARFLKETDETITSLQNKLILDAGCGNGILNTLLAQNGIANIALDLSNSIEKNYEANNSSKAQFIQGDLQFPPLADEQFDLLHSSGVLHHTNNTELTLSCVVPLLKKQGKISIWLYQPRKNVIHNLFNFIRNYTSKLPYGVQHYVYLFTLFPISYIVKKIKGNKETPREMFVAILDWFSPEFRWEHTQLEAEVWLRKRNFKKMSVTTNDIFGFNIIGEKEK